MQRAAAPFGVAVALFPHPCRCRVTSEKTRCFVTSPAGGFDVSSGGAAVRKTVSIICADKLLAVTEKVLGWTIPRHRGRHSL